MFNRLSVFAGGFSLAAASAVACDADTDGLDVEDAVVTLANRSMLTLSRSEDGPRYALLETLRQFGEEQLVASGLASATRTRHVAWYANFARDAWTGLWSANDGPWIRAVGHEFDNIRAAIFTAIDAGDHAALSELIRPLYWWAWCSLRYEVAEWAIAAMGVVPEPANAREVATVLCSQGGRLPEAVRFAQELHDRVVIAPTNTLTWSALLSKSSATMSPDVQRCMDRAVACAEAHESEAHVVALGVIRVTFLMMDGRTAEAQDLATRMHERSLRSGNIMAIAWCHFEMGRAFSETDAERALAHFDACEGLAKQFGYRLLTEIASTEAAGVLMRCGDATVALKRLTPAAHAFIASHDSMQLWSVAHQTAALLLRFDRTESALHLWSGLGTRRGYASHTLRTELMARFGEPAEPDVTDAMVIERVQAALRELAMAVVLPTTGSAK